MFAGVSIQLWRYGLLLDALAVVDGGLAVAVASFVAYTKLLYVEPG